MRRSSQRQYLTVFDWAFLAGSAASQRVRQRAQNCETKLRVLEKQQVRSLVAVGKSQESNKAIEKLTCACRIQFLEDWSNGEEGRENYLVWWVLWLL